MSIATGRHILGPGEGTLLVKTYREGMAAKVGHDLVIEVSGWDATIDVEAGTIDLSADPQSLEVREGVRGIKPLTDKDRADIAQTIDEKVLRGKPISLHSRSVRAAEGKLTVEGELTMAESTRPISATLDVADDGHVTGTIPVTQSEWGIKPYRGLMGALKVRDELEIVIDARLPTAAG